MRACTVLALLVPALGLHEITGPDFNPPLNNTFDEDHDDLPRLDFNELSAPFEVDLNAIPASLAKLYKVAGVQWLRVTYDPSVEREGAIETATFPGEQRLAACPPRNQDGSRTDFTPTGPFLASPNLQIGVFDTNAASGGFSGFNIKFVESARQLQFSIQDEAAADILVRTYLTSVDEDGNEVRVLQEELVVPTVCAQDPNDPRVCARNGRIDGRMIVCIQADESCFDEVEILRASSAVSPSAGFCVDDLMLGSIQHGRRFSTVVGENNERKQCGRSATLAKGDVIVSRFVSFTSAADAEWQSIGLNHPLVNDDGSLDAEKRVTSDVYFGQLGTDFSNPERIALQEGKRAFRYWPNPLARDTFFELTAFWLSDENPEPELFDGGGHWHPSTLCEPGCGGVGYEQHHAYSDADRQGFTVEFIVNGFDQEHGGLVDGNGRAEFQVAYFDYRNVGGHPDETDYPVLLDGHPEAPDHAPGYAPLEVCVGPDVAHEYTKLSEFLACPDLRTYGPDTYLPASHLTTDPQVPSLYSLGCCGRVVFGCVFLGSDEGTVHACLWYEITNQADQTRDTIWDNFAALGAQVDSEKVNLIDVIRAAGEAVRDEIDDYELNITETVGAQANQTRDLLLDVFRDLGVQLFNVSESAQENITRDGNETFHVIGAQENQTRVEFIEKADRVLLLVNQSIHYLLNDTEVVNWAIPIINKATNDTYENIRLLMELIDLLDNMPSDIDAHTLMVVEIAEKEVLVRLLQLKARLASMDGERKQILDEIKACMVVNRIKLERTVDMIRRLSDTSSESWSSSSSSSSSSASGHWVLL